MRKRERWISVVGMTLPAVVLVLLGGYVLWGAVRHPVPVRYGYRVVNEYPHDGRASTQGLLIEEGVLYEGCGGVRTSSVRRVAFGTEEVLEERRLEGDLFGEGITAWKNEIIQLTWKAGVGIVYDRESLEEKGRFSYRGEGWGLTQDGTHLIMSDGSARLRFLDPDSIRDGGEAKEVRSLRVRDRWRFVTGLNELEFVDGEVFANILGADRIARISPGTGDVLGYIDLDGLYPDRERPLPEAVLNGIAHDREAGKLYVTGKLWPRLYEIEVVPRDGRPGS